MQEILTIFCSRTFFLEVILRFERKKNGWQNCVDFLNLSGQEKKSSCRKNKLANFEETKESLAIMHE